MQYTDPQKELHFPELQRVDVISSWLLDLYEKVGGERNTQGRGAPWPMRLFIGGLLHVPIDQRDGNFHSFLLPTDDVIRWLYPDGWPNKKSRWNSFPTALRAVNNLGWVSISGVGSVKVLDVSVIPENSTDPFVQFIARVPPCAAHGATIDWIKLCEYGKESAPLYRGYLTACEFMHRSANDGRPITQLIGRALVDKDGKPRRKKGGKVVRSKTEFEDNPLSRYVKGLNKGQLAAAIGLDAQHTANHGRALEVFERLDDDGVINLKKEGRGRGVKYHIFGPNRWVDAQAEVIK